MKIFFFVFFVLTALQFPAFGQTVEVCRLNLSSAPSLRGFKLGMPLSEVKRAYPKLQIPVADEFGVSIFRLTFYPLPDRLESCCGEAPNSFDTAKFPQFKGVEMIEIELLDNKVATLLVRYDASIKWRNLGEFVSESSKSLNLIYRWSYEATPENSSYATMQCTDFRIEAEVDAISSSLILVNPETIKAVEKRKSDAETDKKKSFKP